MSDVLTFNKNQIPNPEIDPANLTNRIVQEVEGMFNDADWQIDNRNTPPILNTGDYDIDAREYVRTPYDTEWLGYVYGSKVVRAPDGQFRGANLPLEALPRIHQHLSDTVLKGEHARVATLVDAENMGDMMDPRNQNLWLSMLGKNQWPIMRFMSVVDAQPPEYSSHDYADFHLGNLVLFPGEVQDLISEVVVHEQAQRKAFHAGGVASKIMLLPGENIDEDPYATHARTGSNRYIDGIDKIDNLTDIQYYFNLLTYLIDEPDVSCDDRLGEVMNNGNGEVRPVLRSIDKAQIGLQQLEKQVADIVNYNSRHRDRVAATPELVEQEMNKVLGGVVRVARKIRGEIREDELATAA